MSAAPAWKIVEAGKDSSFVKEFAEPALIAVTKIVTKEIEEMGKQLKKERHNGRTR
jgi:hypothetical protein